MNCAKVHLKNAIVHLEHVRGIYEKLLPLLKFTNSENETIMDLGCGSGRLLLDFILPQIPNKSAKIIASDLSADMIQFCKHTYKNPNIEFMQLDIEEKKLPERLHGRLDHLFSTFCIQYALDLKQVIKNSYTMLKPGGDLLFIFASENILYLLQQEMLRDFKHFEGIIDKRYKDYMPVSSMLNPIQTVKNIFKEEGFQIHYFEYDENYTVQHDTFQDLFDLMLALIPIWSELSLEQAKLFQDALNEKAKKSPKLIYRGDLEPAAVRFPLFSIVASKPY